MEGKKGTEENGHVSLQFEEETTKLLIENNNIVETIKEALKSQKDSAEVTIKALGAEDELVTIKGVKEKNVTLERESQGCCQLLSYMTSFILLDLWKQVSSYGMKYYNDEVYPVPPTMLVFVSEIIKLMIFLVKLCSDGTLTSVKLSYYFLIPSFIYAINNNVYYFALHYTSPPVWNVITQIRIILMAIVYRLFFKKQVSKFQWLALVILMGAIAMAKLSGAQVQDSPNHLFITLTMAFVASSLAVLGAVVTEYLFKNDHRSFGEMQLQLYLFGSMCSGVLFGIEKYTQEGKTGLFGERDIVYTLVILCVVFSVTSGLVTAQIMKKLDNIVKLYTQSLSNIITSLACVFIFPNNFKFDVQFFISMVLVFIAILMYEHQTMSAEDLKQAVQKFQNFFRNSYVAFSAKGIVILVLVSGIVFWVYSIKNMKVPTRVESTSFAGS